MGPLRSLSNSQPTKGDVRRPPQYVAALLEKHHATMAEARAKYRTEITQVSLSPFSLCDASALMGPTVIAL